MNNTPLRHIRVLHIGPDREARGGIASLLYGLHAEKELFNRHGIELQLLGTTKPLGGAAIGKIWLFVRVIFGLLNAIIRSNVELVHLHSALKGSLVRKVILAWLCKCFRVPYIFHVHNGEFFENVAKLGCMWRYPVNRALRNSERIIVLSRQMKEVAIASGVVCQGKCALVYNGIADPLSRMDRRSIEKECVEVVFLGLISPDKGVAELLDAVEKLKENGVVFHLTVYGNGDVSTFLDQVTKRGLQTLVAYGGWLGSAEKFSVLESADIFALPSRNEGFSIAILEAMSHGLAIISTAIPGVVEAVRDGKEGILVPPKDGVALATRLEELIGNEDFRLRLGVAARLRYLSCFTVERMIIELVQIYVSVPGKRFGS